jgi:uncharacterized membrane-anchored protein
MKNEHVPELNRRFWGLLCVASVFGANLGDYFAHDVGLGHIRGLPFLAVALAAVFVAERFDRAAHEVWCWLAIILIRAAATNIADFLSTDLRLPRLISSVVLAAGLAVLVALVARRVRSASGESLHADAPYWVGMLLAGVLGTVIGDYLSHDLHLGNARGGLILSTLLAAMFAIGARGAIWRPALFWAAIVAVRAAGTCIGDYFAARPELGIAWSTVMTGIAFVLVFVLWRERSLSARAAP